MKTIDNIIDKLPLTIGNGTMDKSRLFKTETGHYFNNQYGFEYWITET